MADKEDLEEGEEEDLPLSLDSEEENDDGLNENFSENGDISGGDINDGDDNASEVSGSSPTFDNNGLLVKYDFGSHFSQEETAESTVESEQQVRDGLLEIKKLDRHLKRLSKMELESKRSRLRFEARMALEIEQLSSEFPNSANNSLAVQANTMKFLAIDFPSHEKRKKLTKNLPQVTSGDNSHEESATETTDSDVHDDDEDSDDSDVVPIFATELDETQFSKTKLDPSSVRENNPPNMNGSRSSSSEYVTARSSASEGPVNGDQAEKQNKGVHRSTRKNHPPLKAKEAFVTNDDETSRVENQKKAKPRKNFVARNIQLAMDAASNVPMTDDEKKRLSELLADIDEEPDDNTTESGEIAESEHALVPKNSNRSVNSRTSVAISLLSEGYRPADHEIEKLSDIDNKLRSLCSQQGSSRSSIRNLNGSMSGSLDTWRDTATVSSIRALPGPTQNSSRLSVLHETKSDEYALSIIMEDIPTVRSSDFSQDSLGEKALMEVREARELSTRLETIDEQLAELTESHPYPVEVDLPKLPSNEIRSLVSQCVSALSGRDNDDESVVTYDEVLASATRLPDSTLRELLDQAKQELGLLTLEPPEPVNVNPRDSQPTSFSQLYDNETWSFLREVEANLEYPPAFLRSLPDADTQIVEKVVDSNGPSVAELTGGPTGSESTGGLMDVEPPLQTFSGRLADIRESQETATPRTPSPALPPEELIARSAYGRFKDRQSPQSSSPTLPPLSGKRHSFSKPESGGRASAESRKGSSSNSLEKELSSLRLDGTSCSSTSIQK